MWRGGNFSPHVLFLEDQKNVQVKNNGEYKNNSIYETPRVYKDYAFRRVRVVLSRWL